MTKLTPGTDGTLLEADCSLVGITPPTHECLCGEGSGGMDGPSPRSVARSNEGARHPDVVVCACLSAYHNVHRLSKGML